MTQNSYDVVVVGGGAAGLAGALALARSRRSVLVIDAGDPRNAPADHVHNYLGREGASPADLYAVGRGEIEQYGAEVRPGSVLAAEAGGSGGSGFTVVLEDGTAVSARRLLLATGARDTLPVVPGLAERWGKDVIHCPYCHGWEVRDQAIGVLASNSLVAHAALLFRQLSDDVVVFLNGRTDVSDDDLARLRARGVRIVPGAVAEVLSSDDRLTGIRLASGEVVPRDALAISTYVDVGSDLLVSLGLATVPVEMAGVVVGTAVPADPTGKTSVPGVWAAGNLVAPMAQVIASAAAGMMAGAMINMDLVNEETAAAVAELEEAS